MSLRSHNAHVTNKGAPQQLSLRIPKSATPVSKLLLPEIRDPVIVTRPEALNVIPAATRRIPLKARLRVDAPQRRQRTQQCRPYAVGAETA